MLEQTGSDSLNDIKERRHNSLEVPGFIPRIMQTKQPYRNVQVNQLRVFAQGFNIVDRLLITN